LMSAVEVEIKMDDFTEFSAVRTPPMFAEPLLREKRVPGVEVLMPRDPPAVKARRVEVARIEPAPPVGTTTRNRSSVCW